RLNVLFGLSPRKVILSNLSLRLPVEGAIRYSLLQAFDATIIIRAPAHAPLRIKGMANIGSARALILEDVRRFVDQQRMIIPRMAALTGQKDGVPGAKGAPAVQPEDVGQQPTFGNAHILVTDSQRTKHRLDRRRLLRRQRGDAESKAHQIL